MLPSFHPAVEGWFRSAFDGPTDVQLAGWSAIASGRHTLVAAPTGSGKTLAGFLSALDGLVRRGLDGGLPDETSVLYVSPLKALGNDIERNLQLPLAGIRAELAARGLPDVAIRTAVRTGDTPAKERAAATKRPPHVLVTTPESLYVLLGSEGGRRLLAPVRTVIVDEIHAVLPDKRGAHLALSLERLEALAGRRLLRIGLSATQRPIDEVARFLVGARAVADDGTPDCAIVDAGHRRALDVGLEVPRSPLEAVMSGEVWTEVYDRLAALVREHRTTLVFVNTRKLSERVARFLEERLGAGVVASHHGSLSRAQRLSAEARLKDGTLRVLVATASLELGIDVGAVDLVCQVGSPRAISTWLQRVGRAGHRLSATPKGRLFPVSRDDLVECAALLLATHAGDLERRLPREAPLDVLAQQIVAEAACRELPEAELLALVRGAWPYRALPPEELEQVVAMLADGFTTRRGRRAAHLFRDRVGGRLVARRGARIAALTSGGAIPDTADYQVILEPEGTPVGTLNEDFAIESNQGDVFQLGNTSWRILKVEPGKVRVEDARGQPPTIPFWLGEAPARSEELSSWVSRLREGVERALEQGGLAAAEAWLEREGIAPAAAAQVVAHLGGAKLALGALPTTRTLVLERFFDEAGGMQLVLHAPFGARLTRALGLSLRKCFCRAFNFELQAAATDDAVILSLGPTHSFPLEDVPRFLHPDTVRHILTQALLAVPMFGTRFRWNATRSLAVLRFAGGRKVPPPRIRMQSEDLLTLVFPDQVACAENLAGEREVPDHPLVKETIRDCLTEAMDVDGLERLLRELAAGTVRVACRDLTEPSPLAAEVLGARPYAFLDDAPLEERRTQAVLARRFLDPEKAEDLGRLDEAAIARVRDEAWPTAETADELADALGLLGLCAAAEGTASGWAPLFDRLREAGRATEVRVAPGAPALWVAAERLAELRALAPSLDAVPSLALPPTLATSALAPEEAAVALVRGRLEATGPSTAAGLAARTGLPELALEGALLRLEAEGFVLRGRFTPAVGTLEFCERRLLARIHRATVERLRREIEPVPIAGYLRFLAGWQRVSPASRGDGPGGLSAALEGLEGFAAPAAAWESELLPARLRGYDPSWLDGLCLSGRIAWGRFGGGAAAPVRTTPILLLPRATLPAWDAALPPGAEAALSPAALRLRDASFFFELRAATGLPPAEAEAALAELVAAGLVSSDGFAGLRALTYAKKASRAATRRGPGGLDAAGRWSRLRAAPRGDGPTDPAAVEAIARALLRRWGVVFRRLLDREGPLPPWRELLLVLRRLEARGELRGGRFVAGPAGEQYALPEAVGALRAVRRAEAPGEHVAISAADPLNLTGLLVPGDRVPATAGNRLVLRDGVPVAWVVAGKLALAPGADAAAVERAVGKRAASSSRRRSGSSGTPPSPRSSSPARAG